MVPGPTPGILQELAHLLAEHTGKSIIVQPPASGLTEEQIKEMLKEKYTPEFWNVATLTKSPMSNRHEVWMSLQQDLRAALGVELPRLRKDGQLVLLSNPMNPAISYGAEELQRAIEQLPSTQTGLCAMLTLLGPAVKGRSLLRSRNTLLLR